MSLLEEALDAPQSQGCDLRAEMPREARLAGLLTSDECCDAMRDALVAHLATEEGKRAFRSALSGWHSELTYGDD